MFAFVLSFPILFFKPLHCGVWLVTSNKIVFNITYASYLSVHSYFMHEMIFHEFWTVPTDFSVEFMEHGNHMGLVNPLGFQMRKSYASALARSGLLSSGRITWHGLGKLY